MSALARLLDVPKGDGLSLVRPRVLRELDQRVEALGIAGRCRVRTRAGLGRSGGAVHGANFRRVRRLPRSPPVQDQEEEYDSGTDIDGSQNGAVTEEEGSRSPNVKEHRDYSHGSEGSSLIFSAPEAERSAEYVVALVSAPGDVANSRKQNLVDDSIQVNVTQQVIISSEVGDEVLPHVPSGDSSPVADTTFTIGVHSAISSLDLGAKSHELVAEGAISLMDTAEGSATGEVVESGAAAPLELGGLSSADDGQVAETSSFVEKLAVVADTVVKTGQLVVDQIAEILPDPVVKQAGQVVEQVSQSAEQVVEQVAATAAQVTDHVTSKVAELLSLDDDDSDSDDEFEAFKTAESAEFRGMQGLQNFTVLQDDEGLLGALYNFYIFMMKKPLPEFSLGMVAAPILNSLIFTVLYLPEFEGLALDETARQFFEMKGGTADFNGDSPSLQLSWSTLFQVFMFSLSLSTGLEPELSPLSPYTLVVANVNALVSQLLFVFLSGAVFARLTQPSQPVRCSTVALICPPIHRRRKQEVKNKVLMVRYVLAGPQPCELVDVKVDLAFKYNTLTRTGTYFRATQSLKLMYHGESQVRPEIAYQNLGMLVRHVIDESSPLYGRSPEMLNKEDAIFVFSVLALEKSSMQSIFHVQHYCVADDNVIWDAEFEDMILIGKRNKRILDHSKLSCWRPL
eukprot:TRINITY_DN3573_c0_g1_i1.p1 TRINITY_DN3573_c0_g1~~TRINITY_DN3573_c0_g1_i1.p1  ORF type:complete len:682 (-),score=135.45 TRINITY_DN3573_c0_g1_i1:191-2236(-)